jgi:hypothetical protein
VTRVEGFEGLRVEGVRVGLGVCFTLGTRCLNCHQTICLVVGRWRVTVQAAGGLCVGGVWCDIAVCAVTNTPNMPVLLLRTLC